MRIFNILTDKQKEELYNTWTNDFLTVENFASHLGVDFDTTYYWLTAYRKEKIFKEFLRLVKKRASMSNKQILDIDYSSQRMQMLYLTRGNNAKLSFEGFILSHCKDDSEKAFYLKNVCGIG